MANPLLDLLAQSDPEAQRIRQLAESRRQLEQLMAQGQQQPMQQPQIPSQEQRLEQTISQLDSRGITGRSNESALAQGGAMPMGGRLTSHGTPYPTGVPTPSQMMRPQESPPIEQLQQEFLQRHPAGEAFVPSPQATATRAPRDPSLGPAPTVVQRPDGSVALVGDRPSPRENRAINTAQAPAAAKRAKQKMAARRNLDVRLLPADATLEEKLEVESLRQTALRRAAATGNDSLVERLTGRKPQASTSDQKDALRAKYDKMWRNLPPQRRTKEMEARLKSAYEIDALQIGREALFEKQTAAEDKRQERDIAAAERRAQIQAGWTKPPTTGDKTADGGLVPPGKDPRQVLQEQESDALKHQERVGMAAGMVNKSNPRQSIEAILKQAENQGLEPNEAARLVNDALSATKVDPRAAWGQFLENQAFSPSTYTGKVVRAAGAKRGKRKSLARSFGEHMGGALWDIGKWNPAVIGAEFLMGGDNPIGPGESPFSVNNVASGFKVRPSLSQLFNMFR